MIINLAQLASPSVALPAELVIIIVVVIGSEFDTIPRNCEGVIQSY